MTENVEGTVPQEIVSAKTGKPLGKDRLRQLARVAKGLCPMCGKANDRPPKRCSVCQLKARAHQQAKDGFKPWEKGKRGRPPLVYAATASSPVEAQP